MKRAYITKQVRTEVLGQHPKCHWCGVDEGPFHIDHLVPVAKGGQGNIENLTAACQTCNTRRQDKEIWRANEWLPPLRGQALLQALSTALCRPRGQLVIAG